MDRAVTELSQKNYDVIVIGGGIYGACVARDAALRGLTVALVEQGDFSSGASGNNHKIIHGGLRYLQHADLKRMRESIRERSTFIRIAPHLVSPIPFLIPIYWNHSFQKWLMKLALMINDLVGFDRNRRLPKEMQFPRSRVVSRDECRRLVPIIDPKRLVGGGLYYDAQVYDPNRFVLSILWSAYLANANLANYVKMIGFLKNENKVIGIQALDILTGRRFPIRGKIIVNCAGHWNDHVCEYLGGRSSKRRTQMAKAFVLVTRQVLSNVALGVTNDAPYEDLDAIINKGSRYFFITPWRNRSLIGTFQVSSSDDPLKSRISENDIDNFVQEVNRGMPSAKITRNDIFWVNWGLLPTVDYSDRTKDAQLSKHSVIYDHEIEDNVEGLVTVVGVKFTTARAVGQKVTDLILRKLKKPPQKCVTTEVPIHGGTTGRVEQFVETAVQEKPRGLSENIIRHLIGTYGSEYRQILSYLDEDPILKEPIGHEASTIKAEIVHGIRKEMANKLSDVVFRRTELGTAGCPGEDCLQTCAMIMAKEMNWDQERIQLELNEVRTLFKAKMYG